MSLNTVFDQLVLRDSATLNCFGDVSGTTGFRIASAEFAIHAAGARRMYVGGAIIGLETTLGARNVTVNPDAQPSVSLVVGGAIDKNYTTTSSTSTDGTENDLFTKTLIANTLSVDGATIIQVEHINLVGHASATRRVRKYFGGTAIFDTGTITPGAAGANLAITTAIFRESSSVVRVNVSCVTNPTTAALITEPAPYTRITGLTLSNTQILKTTGVAAGAGAASGDINDIFQRIWGYIF